MIGRKGIALVMREKLSIIRLHGEFGEFREFVLSYARKLPELSDIWMTISERYSCKTHETHQTHRIVR